MWKQRKTTKQDKIIPIVILNYCLLTFMLDNENYYIPLLHY